MSITTFVTFGQMYAREPHPTFDRAHPDGWLEVEGPDYLTCRTFTYELLQGKFATDYTREHFDPSWHPLGCLARFDATTGEEITSGRDQ